MGGATTRRGRSPPTCRCDPGRRFPGPRVKQDPTKARAWLTASHSDEAYVLAPEAMQIALRRRSIHSHLDLLLTSNCVNTMPGCGRPLGPLRNGGDHGIACPRTGLLAQRAKIVGHAWVRVARGEAIGPDVPQQWLTHTMAPGVASDYCHPFDMVVLGSEVGGRLGTRAQGFRARPRSPPQAACSTRPPPGRGYRLGWTLSVAVQRWHVAALRGPFLRLDRP